MNHKLLNQEGFIFVYEKNVKNVMLTFPTNEPSKGKQFDNVERNL